MKDILKHTWKKSGKDRGMGILLALGLGMMAYAFTPTGQYLRHLSHDLPYLVQSHRELESSPVVILKMDDYSESILYPEDAPELWDRTWHARVLQELDRRGASLVVFDLLFDRPWPDPEVDARFAQALAEVQCEVVLAARLDEPDLNTEGRALISRLVKAIKPLADQSDWGIMEQPSSNDGVIRRHALDVTHPNLAWRSAQLLDLAPENFQGHEWIHYYGARHFIPTISYAQLFQSDTVPRETLAGKIVIVGEGRRFDADDNKAARLYATPLSRWHEEPSTGPEIHATILLNLLRGDWLKEMTPVWEWSLFLTAGLVFGTWLPRFRPLPLLGMSLIAAGVVGLLVLWLFHQQNVWFPWLIIVGVQLPAVTLWAFLMNGRRLLRQREILEKIVVRQSLLTPSIPPPVRTSESPAAFSRDKPRIPDHSLLFSIGRGAYGEVWLARNQVGLFHAVKLVHRQSFDQAAPYEREFNGIKKFMPISRTHPGLVHLLHVGRNDQAGYFYYIMELGDDQAHGTSIIPDQYQPRNLARDLHQHKRLPLQDCLELGLALSDTLDHLHRHNLVHRDIKPSNIIFVQSQPKLADIGLVTELNGAASKKTFIGTEGYIPPEGAGSPAADVFSLGKVLYEAVMGRDRFRFPDFPTTLVHQVHDPQLQALNRVILKACEYDVARRYSSAAELRHDLEALLNCHDPA